MSVSLDTASFRFETSYNTEDVRPGRQPERSRIGMTDDQFFVLFALMGIACLFWRYTIALGAALLAVTTFAWAMRERSRAIRKRYEHLREPAVMVHVVVTDSGYSLRGDGFSAETTWGQLINGIEMEGRLLLQSWHMPRVYVPIEDMQRAGVYERVTAIVDPRSAAWKAAHAEAAKVRP